MVFTRAGKCTSIVIWLSLIIFVVSFSKEANFNYLFKQIIASTVEKNISTLLSWNSWCQKFVSQISAFYLIQMYWKGPCNFLKVFQQIFIYYLSQIRCETIFFDNNFYRRMECRCYFSQEKQFSIICVNKYWFEQSKKKYRPWIRFRTIEKTDATF